MNTQPINPEAATAAVTSSRARHQSGPTEATKAMPKTLVDLESCRQPAIRAVNEIFATMLATETWALAQAPSTLPEHSLVGAVYLAGDWQGAVLLETSAAQAFVWTQRLMSIPAPESLDDDVRDTIGELASMIGGNLKSVLPVEIALSMPSTIEGRQFTLRLVGDHQKIKVDFASPEGPFSVTLVQLTED
jgi:chemotaxis protein CheX